METPDTSNALAAPTEAPTVIAVVVERRSGDLSDVLRTVGSQVYDPQAVFVVGRDPIGLGDAPVRRVATMAEVLAEIGTDVSYLWIVDQDARPRPDALKALVAGAEQTDAGVAGSKLLRSDEPAQLVSVGAATDVFGFPYTGLEVGELDQEQYDVVRDVAFVEPASVLIRRDLLAGLGGLDRLLPFESAGLDLCQRARLAGGRVVVVPSAEALFVGVFPERTLTWREQAGRIRSMLKSYSLLTLVWAIPLLLLIGLIMGIYRTFRGRPLALLDWIRAWAWNVLHIGSTLRGRVRARTARQAGDDELFRYQVGGSVEMKSLAAGLSDRLGSLEEEEVDPSMRGMQSPSFWQQPAFLAGLVSIAYVAVATRSIWSDGLPVVGFALPLRDSAMDMLRAFAGGWNPAELGSPAAFHPSVGASAVIQLVLFSRAGLATAAITVGSVAMGVVGMARLGRSLGVGPWGRHLSGMVLMSGPLAAFVAGEGAWPGLVAIGFVPWAVGAMFTPVSGSFRHRLAWFARCGLAITAVAVFAPVALLVPLVAAVIGFAFYGGWRRVGVAVVATVIAAGTLLPWLSAQDLDGLISDGTPLYYNPRWWTVAITAAAAVITIVAARDASARLAGWGATMATLGVFVARSARLGTGRELSTAGMVLAAFGVAVVVSAAFTATQEMDIVGALRRSVGRLAPVAGTLLVALALWPVPLGRVGLPADAFGESLGFASSRAEAHGPDRLLLIGPGDTLPGEVRRLDDGTAYRLVGGPMPHLDEAWPATPRIGDEALSALLERIVAGGELRPGELLASFGVRWVVFTGPNTVQAGLGSQLDLKPLPDLDYETFENEVSSPRAVTDDGVAWTWEPPGYSGPPSGSVVRITENADARWGPGAWQQSDWANLVEVGQGRADFAGDDVGRMLAWAAGAVALLLVVGSFAGIERRAS